jgi:acetoacetate decarboxylase
VSHFVSYIWVDNDFTLVRGFIQGFPKKLGRIYITRLHELTPKIGGKQNLPPIRFYLMRHFPNIEDPVRPSVHELTVATVSNVKIKDVWAGDAQIKFFESPFEEVADLGPVKAQAAFFFSMGLTITGGKVIHKYV